MSKRRRRRTKTASPPAARSSWLFEVAVFTGVFIFGMALSGVAFIGIYIGLITADPGTTIRWHG